MISLTDQLSYHIGTTVQETADTGALVNASVTWAVAGGPGPGGGGTDTIRGELAYGTVSKGRAAAFTRSPRATSIFLTIDLATGNWTASNGMSGTIPDSDLAAFEDAVRNIRNGLEQFASQGIMPGKQNPW